MLPRHFSSHCFGSWKLANQKPFPKQQAWQNVLGSWIGYRLYVKKWASLVGQCGPFCPFFHIRVTSNPATQYGWGRESLMRATGGLCLERRGEAWTREQTNTRNWKREGGRASASGLRSINQSRGLRQRRCNDAQLQGDVLKLPRSYYIHMFLKLLAASLRLPILTIEACTWQKERENSKMNSNLCLKQTAPSLRV